DRTAVGDGACATRASLVAALAGSHRHPRIDQPRPHSRQSRGRGVAARRCDAVRDRRRLSTTRGADASRYALTRRAAAESRLSVLVRATAAASKSPLLRSADQASHSDGRFLLARLLLWVVQPAG